MKVGIISTAANPLHAGHLALAEWGDKNGYYPVFEIPSVNADKGAITKEELNKRIAQLENIRRPVISTDKSTFAAKMDHIRALMNHREWQEYLRDYYAVKFTATLAHKYFFVGFDTILRIDNPKYYYDSIYERDRLLNRMDKCFVVFPRNGQLDLSKLSPVLASKCIIAENFTEVRMSSTEIREQSNILRSERFNYGG